MKAFLAGMAVAALFFWSGILPWLLQTWLGWVMIAAGLLCLVFVVMNFAYDFTHRKGG